MAANRLLSQPDYHRLAEFRYLLRRFLAFSERAAAKTGLSPQQHQALLAIKGLPQRKITIGVLAERLGVRHNTAVELIDRLIANRLVERRQSADDRRQVLIELTGRAERLLAKMSLAHSNELKKMAPLLRELLEHFDRPSQRARKKLSGHNARRRNGVAEVGKGT
jgi:DNA-binding MarR family transcriptional regulator